MQKSINAKNGFIMLALFIALVAVNFLLYTGEYFILAVIVSLFLVVYLIGFVTVKPNYSIVFTFFGKYAGTLKDSGFFWLNPLYGKESYSLRANNFDSEKIKVNDKNGNPIRIGVVLVWKVEDTYKAAFDVDNYERFVNIQVDVATRKIAASYPFDNFDSEKSDEATLIADADTINKQLEKEISNSLEIAGIKTIEARIGYLAYAEEVAASMLKRQQASAVIAARTKIVEGAVDMVEDAINKLEKKKIVELDNKTKANMISNLMVVLCGDEKADAVITLEK